MHRNISTIVFVCLLLTLFALPTMADQAASVDQLRSQAEELVLKQAEMGWNSWVLGEPSNQAALYNDYPELFTKQSIDTVKTALGKETDPVKRKQLTFFRNYLEAEYLYKQTAILWDIYSDLEAELKVLVNGELVPYRELRKYMYDAKSAEERAKMGKEQYRIYKLLNDVILNRELEMSHRIVKDLGYTDYLELAVSYKNFDLDNLLKLCETFLRDTEKEYLELFDEVSSIPRDQFHRSDIVYLLGAKDWDEYFPKKP